MSNVNIYYIKKLLSENNNVLYMCNNNLQRGDFIVVSTGHFAVGQRLAGLFIDLEAAVEREHVKQLHEQLALVTCVQ